MIDHDYVIDEILDDGVDDWMLLHTVVGIVREQYDGDTDDARADASVIIRELLEGEWMIAGDLKDTFIPWNSTPSVSCERILQQLDAKDWDSVGNVIAWLCNTPKGNERAAEYRRRGGLQHSPRNVP